MVSFYSHTDVSSPVLTFALFFPQTCMVKSVQTSVYQWYCKHPFSILFSLTCTSDPNVSFALHQLTLRMGDAAIAKQYCFASRLSVARRAFILLPGSSVQYPNAGLTFAVFTGSGG